MSTRHTRTNLASSTDLIRLHIDDMLGRKTTLTVPRQYTVAELKHHIEDRRGIPISDQTLVRRQANNYVRLDDARRLDEYQLSNDDHLMLMPAVRSAPPGYKLKDTKDNSTRVFVDQDGSLSSMIERVLRQSGVARDPNATYMLVQMDGQEDGNYTLLEIKSNRDASSLSSSLPRKLPPDQQKRMNEAERRHNLQTKARMEEVKARLERYKKRRKDTTSISSPSSKCLACGVDIRSAAVTCSKCHSSFCGPEHERDAKQHKCQRRERCRQQ